ncbi:histidine phosphatase family protein [Bacillus sp. JJ1533]|uniref:histidine phosphatase family protein n=1 Tax=Bacillus sp. JJ1533 TaxID=3122959 RepID=UPI002FFD9ABB
MKLYFVRHGETEWNVENRLQGHLDSKLTTNGVNRTLLLAEKLANTRFESVISSPSPRAVHTAKILIGNRPLDIKLDERLREINLGNWQGRTLKEIKETDPQRYDCYFHHPELYKPDKMGGESFFDVKKRLEEFLVNVEETYQTSNLLIVTHGVVIKVLQLICKNKLISAIWEPPFIDGTSLTVVKIKKGKKEIIIEGNISHFAKEIIDSKEENQAIHNT